MADASSETLALHRLAFKSRSLRVMDDDRTTREDEDVACGTMTAAQKVSCITVQSGHSIRYVNKMSTDMKKFQSRGSLAPAQGNNGPDTR
jgi:hypothetical protein